MRTRERTCEGKLPYLVQECVGVRWEYYPNEECHSSLPMSTEPPIVATVIIIAVTLLAAIAIGYFAFVVPKFAFVVPKSQTITLPPTDYFSLSCSQLKQLINAQLNHEQQSVGAGLTFYARDLDVFANNLLQIYQMKGCSP